MSLSWDDPGDDSITGYLVLRRCRVLHETGEFMLHVEDRVSESPEYVVPSVRYVYRIKARNAAGLSEQSEDVRRAHAAEPPGEDVSSEPGQHGVRGGRCDRNSGQLGSEYRGNSVDNHKVRRKDIAVKPSAARSAGTVDSDPNPGFGNRAP